MTDVSDVKRKYWAEALANENFYCIETFSGFRGGMHADYKGACHLLSPDASDKRMGDALLDALLHSRFVVSSPREGFIFPPEVEYDAELNIPEKVAERYKLWVEEMMQRYGYKTKRALFKGMRRCSVEVDENTLTILPSHHEKLEAWSGDGISKDDYVVLAAKSSAEEIGAALRLAFSRCT